MPTGVSPSEIGGVIDPADVRGAGPMEWGALTGIHADHPLVNASGPMGESPAARWSRVVTTPAAQAGPAADTIATPEGTQTGGLGNWRDVFNFRGSAAPWLLLAILLVVYLSHLKLRAGGSAGGFGRQLSAGAKLE